MRQTETARNNQRRRREQIAAVIRAMKLERGRCHDCHIAVTEHNLVIFDWDHRDPADKRFGIADARDHQPKGGADTVLAEIAKCDLVCANCHRLRTQAARHYLIWQQTEEEQHPRLFD